MLRLLAALFASVAILVLVVAVGGVLVFSHYGRAAARPRQARRLRAADHVAGLCRRRPAARRVRRREARVRADRRHPQAGDRCLPRRRGQEFLQPPGHRLCSASFARSSPTSATTARTAGRSAPRRSPSRWRRTSWSATSFRIERKIKEAILALQIDRAFSKDRILELYLNEIFLGYGSYGVAAAALNYFNKALDELSLRGDRLSRRPAEGAQQLRSGPPSSGGQGPARLGARSGCRRRASSPPRRRRAARRRRWWSIRAKPTERLRRRITSPRRCGAKSCAPRARMNLYEGGLAVRATVDPGMQALAERVLGDGLEVYDRRHGWRGPVTRIARMRRTAAGRLEHPAGGGCAAARLAGAVAARSRPRLEQGGRAKSASSMAKPEPCRSPSSPGRGRGRRARAVGAKPRTPADVLAVGDVVTVEPLDPAAEGAARQPVDFALKQLPAVEGALVAMDPHSGRVLAMAGGFSHARSQFNRATQADRQTGSAFKPIVYLCAMEHGMTPASIVLDAPFVLDQGPGSAAVEPVQLQRALLRPDDPAGRPGAVAQRHDRPPRPDHRHAGGGRLRPAPERVRDRAARAVLCAVLCPGRRRNDPAPADDRLRHAGQRRQVDHADADRPDPGPLRQDHLPSRRAAVRGLPGRRLGGAAGAGDP